jgi:sialidase-1
MRRLTTLVLLSGTIAVLAPSAHGADPLLAKTDLFEARKGGYALYRIPGIVATSKGTLLAYCEARRAGQSDWDSIDVLLRRSTDGGRTWSPPRQVAHFGPKVPKNPVALAQNLATADDQTVNNPVAIVDRAGAIHFLYCVEYARAFYMRSDDEGVSFSQPVEITPAFDKFRPEYPWRVLATGPGHGIQLARGRLIVPVWLSTGEGGQAHRPSVTSVIYSDDSGRTWQRGEIAAMNSGDIVNPNETVVVELADGRTLLNIRSESHAHRRLTCYSTDGATGWSKPEFHNELLEPICMASIVRLSQQPGDPIRLLFANPHNLERAEGKESAGKPRDRKNLSLKLSYDEGATWPVNKPLEEGPSAYSDLAVGPDGTIYCLYERTKVDGRERTAYLTLARFNLEWLTDGKDALAR